MPVDKCSRVDLQGHRIPLVRAQLPVQAVGRQDTRQRMDSRHAPSCALAGVRGGEHAEDLSLGPEALLSMAVSAHPLEERSSRIISAYLYQEAISASLPEEAHPA